MPKIKVKVINQSSNPLPEYVTEGAAGMDIRANLEAPVTLQSLQRLLVPTGLFMELPLGYEAQIRPRSGLAIQHGITCLNSPGTIDADYRGEIVVILINLGDAPFAIRRGERIAQLIVTPVLRAELRRVDTLDDTVRSSGGFGSTGR